MHACVGQLVRGRASHPCGHVVGLTIGILSLKALDPNPVTADMMTGGRVCYFAAAAARGTELNPKPERPRNTQLVLYAASQLEVTDLQSVTSIYRLCRGRLDTVYVEHPACRFGLLFSLTKWAGRRVLRQAAVEQLWRGPLCPGTGPSCGVCRSCGRSPVGQPGSP